MYRGVCLNKIDRIKFLLFTFIYRDMLYLQTTAILQTNDLSSLSLVYLTLIFLVDENRSPLIRRYQYHTLLREVRP